MSETLTGLSTNEISKGYALLRESCGIFAVNDYALFEMSGEDRKAWMQGQATNDFRQLREGGSLSFCFCAPTGQLLAPCTAFMLGDRYLIVTPKACAAAFAERVETMVIMEHVTCTEITDQFAWQSIQGPDATRMLGDLCGAPTMDVATEGDTYLFRYNRTGLGGWDVLAPAGSQLRKKLLKSSEPVTPGAVEIARLEAGIPVFGKDANERTLPPELGPDFESRYISYNKGCYTGQEVLMRIHSRGHTNKTWVGLALEGPAEPGDTVAVPAREDSGMITSVADSPKYGYIAGAMMRNEASTDGLEVRVHGRNGEYEGEVIPMPIMRYA